MLFMARPISLRISQARYDRLAQRRQHRETEIGG